MVERIEGRGFRFEDLSRSLRIESRENYRLMWFNDDPRGYLHVSRIPQILSRLALYPEFDRDSLLIYRAIDRRRRIGDVLVVPTDCPDLLIEGLEGAMPNEEETCVVTAYCRRSDHYPLEILVLSDNDAQAGQIAKIKTSRVIKCEQSEIEVEVQRVTPEEWIDLAREQINRGIRLDRSKLRFADLREQQRRYDEQDRS